MTAEHPRSRPIFARVYDRISRDVDAQGAVAHRRELLAGLSGRVIEVGAGNGRNFAHYPDTVSDVLAVEPERYLRDRAEDAAATADTPVTIVDGSAEHLPADDASFDAGVASLVLCSVEDQDAAVRELYRVLRPGAELRFYEHVVSPRPGLARVQRMADRTIWPVVAGGCHASRDTLSAIKGGGFRVESYRSFEFRPSFVDAFTAHHILGSARRL